jgi:hypothetical protein
LIEVGSADGGGAETPEVTVALVVGEDDDEIRLGCWRARGVWRGLRHKHQADEKGKDGFLGMRKELRNAASRVDSCSTRIFENSAG